MSRHLTRVVLAGLSVSLGVLALSVPAEADHRWRHRRFFPLIEVFPGGWDDADQYAYYDPAEDDELTVEEYERLVKRRHRAAARQWWLEEDDNSFDPEFYEPTPKATKKKTVKKVVAKPVVKTTKPAASKTAKTAKPVQKPTSLVASAAAATLPKTKTVSTGKENLASVSKPATQSAAKPAATGSTIGCTAGAAVVTGYGFGEVKPRTCTGKTYAYTASRGGKSYLIELTASNGEVVNVKKL